MEKSKDIGIYIHIPFCKSKCEYCDFTSFTNKNDKFEAYKNALIKEINSFTQLENYNITTIFIGGGTPTVFPSYFIKEILGAVYRYNVSENAEITIESNPNTLNLNLLNDLKHMGINRISMGLQAWQDKHLKRIGRSHKLGEFLESYNNAKIVGFENINIDLMFSLPDSSFDEWVDTLENVVKLSPTHIAAYSLALEEETPFSKQYDKGLLNLPSEDEDREMYSYTRQFLKHHGYFQYEISNFARSNFESRHNTLYWKRVNYKGFGLASHSFFEGVRTSTISCLDKYIEFSENSQNITAESHLVTREDSMSEFMFLGLRLNEGISKAEFRKNFSVNVGDIFGEVIQENVAKKLLVSEKDRIYLTEKGIDISNYVLCDFLL